MEYQKNLNYFFSFAGFLRHILLQPIDSIAISQQFKYQYIIIHISQTVRAYTACVLHIYALFHFFTLGDYGSDVSKKLLKNLKKMLAISFFYLIFAPLCIVKYRGFSYQT